MEKSHTKIAIVADVYDSHLRFYSDLRNLGYDVCWCQTPKDAHEGHLKEAFDYLIITTERNFKLSFDNNR